MYIYSVVFTRVTRYVSYIDMCCAEMPLLPSAQHHINISINRSFLTPIHPCVRCVCVCVVLTIHSIERLQCKPADSFQVVPIKHVLLLCIHTGLRPPSIVWLTLDRSIVFLAHTPHSAGSAHSDRIEVSARIWFPPSHFSNHRTSWHVHILRSGALCCTTAQHTLRGYCVKTVNIVLYLYTHTNTRQVVLLYQRERTRGRYSCSCAECVRESWMHGGKKIINNFPNELDSVCWLRSGKTASRLDASPTCAITGHARLSANYSTWTCARAPRTQTKRCRKNAIIRPTHTRVRAPRLRKRDDRFHIANQSDPHSQRASHDRHCCVSVQSVFFIKFRSSRVSACKMPKREHSAHSHSTLFNWTGISPHLLCALCVCTQLWCVIACVCVRRVCVRRAFLAHTLVGALMAILR